MTKTIVRQCCSFHCSGHVKLTLSIACIFMDPPDTPFWVPVTAALLTHHCLSFGCPFPAPSASVSYTPPPATTCIHLPAFIAMVSSNWLKPIKVIPDHWFHIWSLGPTFPQRAVWLVRDGSSLPPHLSGSFHVSVRIGDLVTDTSLPSLSTCRVTLCVWWKSPQIWNEGMRTSLRLPFAWVKSECSFSLLFFFFRQILITKLFYFWTSIHLSLTSVRVLMNHRSDFQISLSNIPFGMDFWFILVPQPKLHSPVILGKFKPSGWASIPATACC